jgi:O-antigen/teichoic acid export membrane protein
MVVPFVTIPLALRHLDAERFGLWMAATSFMAVLSLADGGISNSLVTSVAASEARGDRFAVRQLLTNAAMVVGLVSLALLPVGAAIAWGVDWRVVFSLRTARAVAEAPWIVFLVLASTALNLWVNVFVRLRYGLQRIVHASLWELIALASSLPAFFLCLSLDQGTPALVFTLAVLPAFVRGLGGWVFLRGEADLWPQRKLLSRTVQKGLLGAGSMYLLLEVAVALSVTSDQFFIASLVSAEAVPPYTVFNRLYSLPFVLVGLVFQTLWPAYARAAVHGEFAWIRRSFFTSLAMAGGFALVAALFLSATHPWVTRLWLGKALVPTAWLVPGMAIYCVVAVLELGGRNLLYSLDRRRALILLSLTMMVVNVALKLVLLPHMGAAGAIIATDIALFFCMVVPYMWLAKNIVPIPSSNGSPVESDK